MRDSVTRGDVSRLTAEISGRELHWDSMIPVAIDTLEKKEFMLNWRFVYPAFGDRSIPDPVGSARSSVVFNAKSREQLADAGSGHHLSTSCKDILKLCDRATSDSTRYC